MAKKVKTPLSNNTQSVIERIAPVHERSVYLAALVYGRSGTGKTVFASSFPKPLLLLDIREKGTDSISKVEGVDMVAIEKWEELEEIYWFLEGSKSKYKSVVLDQVSQMQALAMEKVRRDENLEPGDLMNRKLWGSISGMMQQWIFAYRDLIDKNFHVCMIAHERANETNDEIEDQIDPSIGPRVMPSVASALNGAVNIIGNTFIREKFLGEVGKEKTRVVEYGMRIGPHAYYTTKVRRPIEFETPDVLVNPTFDKLMSITRGEVSVKRKVLKAKE